jgi:hypothetical protein
MHALLLVLTYSLYAGVLGLQGADSLVLIHPLWSSFPVLQLVSELVQAPKGDMEKGVIKLVIFNGGDFGY